MKATPKAKQLLEKMAKINRMERGKVCQLKGREHFNHQTWQNGRNEVRYVPRERVDDLRVAIDGYDRFMALAGKYADEMIRLTRLEQNSKSPKQPRKSPAKSTRRTKNVKNRGF